MSSPEERAVQVSVICPFYNEAGILGEAIDTLAGRLKDFDRTWELIVVDDGSTDGSGAIARERAARHEGVRVVGYERNRGRGRALRTGLAAARGEILVTTEIDLSWGESVVFDLVGAFDEYPDADIIVASPHLKGGRYENVPFKRVFLSRFGNLIIRGAMGDAVTMNTGMTRAYRRDAYEGLPLTADGKEFHLEVILKAVAFGYRIREIPAVLAWKAYKHEGKRVKRQSSTRVRKHIVSHTLFSLFAKPVRYVWAMSGLAIGVGVFSLGVAIWLVLQGSVSIYMALLSVSMVILGIVLFVMGVVLQQGNTIQKELWEVHRRMRGSNLQ